MSDAVRTISWSHGTLSVTRLGAMLGPVVFRLPNGSTAEPLHRTGWTEAEAGAPPLMRTLRGEWACVPFGYTSPAGPETPPEWATAMYPAEPREEVHGYGSNHDWTWETAEGALALSIDYPDMHPIRRLRREIGPDPEAPAINLALAVEARADCALPLGLHFTFHLPAETGTLRVEPGRFRQGRTYPGAVEPGRSLFAVDQPFASLAAVPARDGSARDATRLPLPEDVEELLQLNGHAGEAAVAWPAEGYRARIAWDASAFPSLLLWLSNRGRTAPPWNGRHLALGMEPICSPFGFGTATAAAANPISASGTPTARTFRAGERWETRYHLTVESL